MENKSLFDMPLSTDNAERKLYLPLLWDIFLQKIDDDWSAKYIHLGSDRNSVEFDTHLANEVHDDIKAEAIARGTSEPSVITGHTIHQYMGRGGFPPRMKANSLQILLRYCGYTDWADFKNRAELDDPSIPTGRQPQGKKINSFRNPWFYLGPIILILILFSFSYPFSQNESEQVLFAKSTTEKTDLSEEVHQLIEGANALEFKLIKRNPDLSDTVYFHNYFTEGSPCINRIKGDLQRAQEQNRSLDRVASSYSIIGTKILEETEQMLTVQSLEHWYLRWEVGDEGKDTLLYKNTNTQRYYVEKTPDGLRIEVNDFDGEVEVLED